MRFQLSRTRHLAIVCVVLLLSIIAAYWPVRDAEFTNFDDGQYVTNNPLVFRGLSWRGFAWAFTSFYASNWHPLTWLSHMVDCTLFGDQAAAHHWMNVGIHAATSILLFLWIESVTGLIWRAGMVAALFALHPLHVESVAWISERKDVLSALFFVLVLWAYQRYVAARSEPGRTAQLTWYSLALGAFALGLMSKPMLVTAPFILLLIDVWPLGRISSAEHPLRVWHASARSALLDKLPFLAFTIASAVVTYLAQKTGGAVVKVEAIPILARCANAALSYLWYLDKLFWPTRLCAYYAFPKEMWIETGAFAAVGLIALTCLFLWVGKYRRYAPVGWLWFMGMLVPVIGLLQVGSQTHADRYAYLPSIGIFLLVTWAVADCAQRVSAFRFLFWPAAAALIVLCAIGTFHQAHYWKSSITLFQHVLEVSPENNFLAEHNLGHALSLKGEQEEAVVHFKKAIAILPEYPVAHFNWGNALGLQGHLDEALEQYKEAIRLDPKYEQAYYNMGKVLVLKGNLEDGRINFLRAIELKPDYGEAMTALGNLRLLQGAPDEGLVWLAKGVNYNPDNPEGHYYLAGALAREHREAEAVREFRETIQLQPSNISALNDLAWLCATASSPQVRNTTEAIKLSRRACELSSFSEPAYLDTYGVALSMKGDLKKAIEQTEHALALARSNQMVKVVEQLEKHIALYREGKVYTR